MHSDAPTLWTKQRLNERSQSQSADTAPVCCRAKTSFSAPRLIIGLIQEIFLSSLARSPCACTLYTHNMRGVSIFLYTYMYSGGALSVSVKLLSCRLSSEDQKWRHFSAVCVMYKSIYRHLSLGTRKRRHRNRLCFALCVTSLVLFY